jgi:hypothetical protein
MIFCTPSGGCIIESSVLPVRRSSVPATISEIPRTRLNRAEQQRNGDHADAGMSEQHDAERDQRQPAQDEQRAGVRRLPLLEGGDDHDQAGPPRLSRGHCRHRHQPRGWRYIGIPGSR